MNSQPEQQPVKSSESQLLAACKLMDACHGRGEWAMSQLSQMEESLNEAQAQEYNEWLSRIGERTPDGDEDCPAATYWYHSPSEHRCEAFLRVHNAWKE